MNYMPKLAVLALAVFSVSSFSLKAMERQPLLAKDRQLLDEQKLHKKLDIIVSTEPNPELRRQKIEALLKDESVITTSLFGFAAAYASPDFVKVLLNRSVLYQARLLGLMGSMISVNNIVGPGNIARKELLKGNSLTIPSLHRVLQFCDADPSRVQVVRLLLEEGADPNQLWHGMTALHILVNHYMYRDFAQDNGDETFFELVNLLLKHNADPSKRSEKGRTPLEEAQAALERINRGIVDKALLEKVEARYQELVRCLRSQKRSL